MIFKIPVRLKCFDLEYIIHSHGWIYLSPFELDDQGAGFRRSDNLGNRTRVNYKVSTVRSGSLWEIRVETSSALKRAEQTELEGRIRYILRLDEDFTSFYEMCRSKKVLHHTIERGGGRLLRGATVFEDLIKTLCTTNTSWSNTKKMVSNLVNKIGAGGFPTAKDIVEFGMKDLSSEIGLGYRAGYLFELCEKIESGQIDISSGYLITLNDDELLKVLKKIKGFGEYSVSHMMVMLGRYGRIPFDSEVRSYYREVFNLSSDKMSEAEDPFHEWGKWKYLAYKFDRIERRDN